MARAFRFRLEPVLEMRQRKEDARAVVLAAAAAELARARSSLDNLCANRDAVREELVRDHRGFDINKLRATYAHLRYLDGEIRLAEERVDACAAVTERERLLLVEASRERQVLATLRERKNIAYQSEIARVEQREIDDLNSRVYDRLRAASGRVPT